MRIRALIGSIAVLALWVADPAGAFISANTIDAQSTFTWGGTRVRATGPIGCTRGERVSLRVTVTQPATAVRARERWNGHCTGEIQHWHVRPYAATGRASRLDPSYPHAACPKRHADARVELRRAG